jgi:hypothetical protein
MVRASPSVLTPKEVDVHLNALKDAPLLRGLEGGRIRQLVERPDTLFFPTGRWGRNRLATR